MIEEHDAVETAAEQGMTDEQKRRLRAVRRGYRASDVVIKDNGWQLEVTYMDGSKVSVSSKLLKLKAGQLQDQPE